MLRSRAWSLGLLVACTGACAANDPSDETNAQVIRADAQDVSPPLRELAKLPELEVLVLPAHEAEPARLLPHMRAQSAVQQPDPVVQNAIDSLSIPSTTINFEGMGAGMAGFTSAGSTAHINGDIGPNHYVQIADSRMAVFNRTGTKLLGPSNLSSLWTGFSGACETASFLGGMVRYDRMADRWVIAPVSTNPGTGQFFQCVAVSTSPDPMGSYARYQFNYTAFNDSPRMGLWPNGYYMTYNMFSNQFAGAKVCAFDRAKMLIAGVATQQCFDTSNTIGGLLASDLDGPTQPPAGSPNYLLALGTNQIAFFKMTVDFANSANSKFVGPTFIPTAAFASPCSGLPCVTQPGTTNKLDTLANRMMARLVYRRFSNHEALLVSHAVAAGTGSGIRFYELRNPTTTPTIFQQGTYAPDTAFRWAGSMAFDSAGDIGLGFSISSSTISPSIRYTGRLATDILGMISQGEATSINGTGAQTIGTGWAESSIDIDPTDDCTFWHMGKYIAGTGSFNWHTRIGSFKFNDFNITVNPGSRTAIAGSITTYIITTTAQCSPQNVALSVSDLPNGVTASFNPTNVTAGGQSTLTLRTSVTTGAGTTRFRITGTSLSATHSVSPSLTVTPNELPALTITSPGNGSTVDGFVTVSATASDTDGIASVQFDLPDGTSVFDTLAPFSATWDSTSVPEGSGYLIHATATDKQGAMSVATATMTVDNCLNNTFSSTGEPIEIPDNDFLGITSSISVTGNGTVASLVLSHDIAHPNVSELKATLLSPDDTSFTVPLGASSKIVEVSTFNGEAAAGTWQLSIVDNRLGDEGKLNSWSLTIVGICPQITHWSSTATPNLPTIDNGMACTSLTVTTEASSLGAKLDIFGRHDFRSILRGTLAHDGAPVAAFPTGTFPSGSGIFSFTNRAVPGLSGDASGTWTLCIIDTDAFGDTGVLTAWSVHD